MDDYDRDWVGGLCASARKFHQVRIIMVLYKAGFITQPFLINSLHLWR